MAAVVMGIVASTNLTSSKASDVNTGQALRKVSIIIFLVFTILQAFQTIILVRSEDQGICFAIYSSELVSYSIFSRVPTAGRASIRGATWTLYSISHIRAAPHS